MVRSSLLWSLALRLLLSRLLIIFLSALPITSIVSANEEEPLQVTITSTGETGNLDPTDYFELVLKLALDKTRMSDGDYVLRHNVHSGGIARDRAMLIAGAGIDVMWGSVTADRAEVMQVVPVDLIKGLNNYRALLIHKDSQQAFSTVKNLADLKEFSAGSGDHWTDGLIFKRNNFNVLFTSNYYSLFKMLSAKRFDFISRGLQEIDYDVRAYQEFGLVAEETILLKYKVPIRISFYVNKRNTSLGDRILRGLIAAQQDGSFDELFYQMPSHKVGDEMLRRSSRTIIEIDNSNK